MKIANESIFLLTSSIPAENQRFGTGFSVAYIENERKLFIITCAHVVDDLKCNVKISGQEAVVEVKGSRESLDLALLSIRWNDSSPPPPILNQFIKGITGKKFHVCGYSSIGSKNPHVLRSIKGEIGERIGFGDDRNEAWDIHIDGDELSNLKEGYSGSPLCDEEGKLIAVVSHETDNGKRGYAISILNLERLLYEKKEILCLFSQCDSISYGDKLQQPTITDSHSSFLNDTGIFAKVHSEKKTVFIDDIFVYPELSKYDSCREYERKISSKELIGKFNEYKKIVISGENQSGKTTLCKKIFLDLYDSQYIPVYISSESMKHAYHGKIENKIKDALKYQYQGDVVIDYCKKNIVIIIDDFHLADHLRRERHIHALSEYRQIIIVDDLFHLNLKNDILLDSFVFFKIEEFLPSLRNQLIENWISLSDEENICKKQNMMYQKIEDATELINFTLGKGFGSGIMPAYPFFVISILTTHETLSTSSDQEITSQGYFYQAFIYLFLRKNNVKNDDIDTYINLMTELSFFFYSRRKTELSQDEFNLFIEMYKGKYNLYIEEKSLISNLSGANLIELDNLGHYSFCYKYLYYFFVAKYLSENIKNEEKTISGIISNLHKKENNYIAIFISHHSKNACFLDEILLNAWCIFDNYKPATLTRDELSFFDKQEELIVKAVLPQKNNNPEIERGKQLQHHDIIEENNKDEEYDDIDDDLLIKLIKSIKTVEVMGCIIKNRAGSIEKLRIEEFIKTAMQVHLRILSHLFDMIKHENQQTEFIILIRKSLSKHINEQKRLRMEEGKTERFPSEEEIESISKKIFWNLFFYYIWFNRQNYSIYRIKKPDKYHNKSM